MSLSSSTPATPANNKTQPAILAGLALLMIATRGGHFSTATDLPSASWAIFFLAGFYVRPVLAFVALIALAGLLDVAAVVWGGVSADCFGPSYPFLVAAYGALWLGGFWLANRYKAKANDLVALVAAAISSSLLCSIISSGSYYLLSGSFANPSLAEFGARMLKYYPNSLQSMAFYVAVAAIIHASVLLVRPASRDTGHSTP